MTKIGIIAASIISVMAFVYYQFIYLKTEIKPNEIYFISVNISLAAFSFLNIRKNHSVFTKLFPIMAGTFFLTVTYLYIKRWILEGHPSTNYYTSLSISAVVTLLYILTYEFIRYIKSRTKHNKH